MYKILTPPKILSAILIETKWFQTLLPDVSPTGVDKIDPDHPKCNPFAYFTAIAFNVYRQKIKTEKKYGQTKQQLREKYYDQFELQEGLKQTQDNIDDED